MRYLFLTIALLFSAPAQSQDTCFGQFPNLFSDICWDCSFPIKLFGGPVIKVDAQEDSTSSDNIPNICTCKQPTGLTKLGFHTSFWEFARQMEVTRTPYCMVTLGTLMNLGINSQMRGTSTASNVKDGARVMNQTFRHAHWYINPAMGLMEIALDSKCMEPKGFDIAYLSEVDPTHADVELERILAPESYLFSNIVAQLACAADCVSSTLGFGQNTLYWCDGCNGNVFPMTGFVTPVYGGVQMSSVMAHRLTAKMHRMLTQTSTAGAGGMCARAGFFQVNMDKTQYKYSMIYPNAQSSGDAASYASGSIKLGSGVPATGTSAESTAAQNSNQNRCCQPFGRTTVLWGSGREIPIPQGQDFGYAIFRKRDCCQ